MVIDFGDALESMLDEMQETYDGRIRSPQGKIIRVQPFARKWLNGRGKWTYRAGVCISALDDGKIYQCKLEAERREDEDGGDSSWMRCLGEMEEMAGRAEGIIRERGFIIKHGRYVFRGERASGIG